MNANAYLANCTDGTMRIFTSEKSASAWDRGARPKICEGMAISGSEVAKHWRGKLPRGGAVFTSQDISFGQLMNLIAWE